MNGSRVQKLLDRIEKAWQNFLESYAGLPESEIMKPGVTGQWSVRDIIAHVTTWEEETLKHLPEIIRGGRIVRYSIQYGGIDAFNALMTARKQEFPFSEVICQQERIHKQLLQYLETVPEEYLDSKSRFRHRLRMDTYSHYPKHAAAIRRWRAGSANNE